jgi:hypothetical protein
MPLLSGKLLELRNQGIEELQKIGIGGTHREDNILVPPLISESLNSAALGLDPHLPGR